MYDEVFNTEQLAFIKETIQNSRIKHSCRMLKALALYNEGLTRAQGAQAMGVSENTFAWHIKKVRSQLQIRTRKELIAIEKLIREMEGEFKWYGYIAFSHLIIASALFYGVGWEVGGVMRNINAKTVEFGFFERINQMDGVPAHKLEQLVAHVPEQISFFWKDEKSRYMGANHKFFALEKYATERDLVKKTDYDIPNLMVGHTPESIEEEDTLCFKGKNVRSRRGVFVPSKEDISVWVYSKVPIIARKRAAGCICAMLNVTEQVFSSQLGAFPTATKASRLSVALSPMQAEVLKLYNQGLPRKTAASILGMAETTYAWHLRQIREHFNVRTRIEMLALEKELTRGG